MNDISQPIHRLAELLARAAHDEALRERLLQDAPATLRAEGIATPQGVALRVVADSASLVHLVLPPLQTGLDDASLDAIAGAGPRHAHFS